MTKQGESSLMILEPKNFDVTVHVPALMEGETKSDWNQVLQRLKKPVKEPFKDRLEQADKSDQARETRDRSTKNQSCR